MPSVNGSPGNSAGGAGSGSGPSRPGIAVVGDVVGVASAVVVACADEGGVVTEVVDDDDRDGSRRLHAARTADASEVRKARRESWAGILRPP